MHVDKPSAAYNDIGLACRLCFQLGLHRRVDSTPYWTHMRQRILWTVYLLDRRISLSCGRPYTMRDQEIDLDEPIWAKDEVSWT
jgi:hypothetical protein